MADDISKKINIDIEISNTGQQQIQQYQHALNNLRTVISGLNNPLLEVSKNIGSLNKNITDLSSSVNKINSNGSSVSTTIGKIGSGVNNVSGTFNGLNKIFRILGVSLGEFEAEITGGLSLLLSFLPVIIDWIGDLFSADKTTKSLTQTLKEHKSALDAVRQAHLQGSQDAQEELTHLKLLYNASQDHNLALAQRKKAVEEL